MRCPGWCRASGGRYPKCRREDVAELDVAGKEQGGFFLEHNGSSFHTRVGLATTRESEQSVGV